MSQTQLEVSGSAKRHVIGYSLAWCEHADMVSPAKWRNLPNSVTYAERGKPNTASG